MRGQTVCRWAGWHKHAAVRVLHLFYPESRAPIFGAPYRKRLIRLSVDAADSIVLSQTIAQHARTFNPGGSCRSAGIVPVSRFSERSRICNRGRQFLVLSSREQRKRGMRICSIQTRTLVPLGGTHPAGIVPVSWLMYRSKSCAAGQAWAAFPRLHQRNFAGDASQLAEYILYIVIVHVK